MQLRSLAVLGSIGIIAACTDTQTAPRLASGTATVYSAVQPMFCTAQVKSGTVTCAPSSQRGEPVANRLLRKDLIVGGQHTYVTLTSSNVSYDGTSDFHFDVTLTNLTPQAFGTSDGATADPAGIKVFLTGQPTVTGGTGNASVANADGLGTFTASNQPYYQYDTTVTNGMLDSGQTTRPVTWHFTIDPTVTTFSFTTYISTPVHYPVGYVKGLPRIIWIDPGSTYVVGPTVYSAVGNVVTTDTLTYIVSDTSVAQGTPDGTITAGLIDTTALLTLSDAPLGRTELDSSLIEVCPSTVVANGSVIPDSIIPSDCPHPVDNATPFFTANRANIYRVSLTVGDQATITTNGGGSLDTYLVLSDSLGRVVAFNDDYGPFFDGSSQIVYTAATTGVYIIQATTFQPSATGYYTLSVGIIPAQPNLSQANRFVRIHQ